MSDHRQLPRPRTVSALLEDDTRTININPGATALRTGMEPLDQALDGGIRVNDLSLLGGQPGVGKTIAALQWARHMARRGTTAFFVCYEHEEADLLSRLFCMELGYLAAPEDAAIIEKLRTGFREAGAGTRSFADVVAGHSLAESAAKQIGDYGDRLHLARGSGRHTDVAALEAMVATAGDQPCLLVVDYLQKVASLPEAASEAEKVTRVAEALKDLALNRHVAVLAIVAADFAGLESKRLRLHHLRGSSALAYESDVVILLNDKRRAVSKAHLAYDPVRAETFKHQVVFSIEKNRHGQALIDVEFRKDFANYRFDPSGGYVAERLVDERFDEE